MPTPPGPATPRVYVSQLQLTNFRNYRRLGLELEPGEAVFCGQNGQGKSNLLEAVYVLATTRSPRTSAERELVSWRVEPPDGLPTSVALPPPEGPPFARLEARVRRQHTGETHLEILLAGQGDGAPGTAESRELYDAGEPAETRSGAVGTAAAVGEVAGRLARSIKVDGLATRAADLLGRLTVVYFSPDDVALAGGAPTGRRRYLDLANSQVAPLYLRALQQYNRILLQRNQVLRLVRARRQSPAALAPWTEQMVRTGAFILRHRLEMLAGINVRVGVLFRNLAGVPADRSFQVVYRPTAWEPGAAPDPADARALAAAYRAHQEALAPREVEQAVSLVGPHRDDFSFVLDGVDLNVYGSRGQQRLAVLALKLAEAEWMRAETGERPVLLLDDVLSELDPQRRGYVLEQVMPAGQAADAPRQLWITTTETDSFPPDLLRRSQRFAIDAGTVRRA